MFALEGTTTAFLLSRSDYDRLYVHLALFSSARHVMSFRFTQWAAYNVQAQGLRKGAEGWQTTSTHAKRPKF
jgi:hypothetical protein